MLRTIAHGYEFGAQTMTVLQGRKILLAVTGGIAAYKAALIVRQLTGAGAQVRCVMTESAGEFITPLTLEVLSGHPVVTELFRPGDESQIGHIEIARWPDAIVIAPATANVIAKMRYGLADDLLTTVLLATNAPILVCPAMNTQMFYHTTVQENLSVLRQRSQIHLLEPDAGDLACGEVGAGRLPDAEVIEDALIDMLEPKPLRGVSMVVSAGPTREHFDPVRFLSNPSTGKMGYAVATKAHHLGADVTLVSGPTSLRAPRGVETLYVSTAQQMYEAIQKVRADVLVMTAAVADYTPASCLEHKRKKDDGGWQPQLQRTVDILASVGASEHRPRTLIGFAAETQHIEEYARKKMEKKGLDGIVANDVSGPDGAFGNEENQVVLISPNDAQFLASQAKIDIARKICLWIATLDEQHR